MRPPLSLPCLGDLPTPVPVPPIVVSSLERHGLSFETQSWDALAGLVGLVVLARPFLNVTALRQPEDLWGKLIVDALLLLPAMDSLPEGSAVVDVGCGGGFPGLPLAIVAPHWHFTLVDATAKKIAFVRHVADQLKLKNVRAVAGRAEQLAAPVTKNARAGRFREQFDWVTAKAVAALPLLLELTSPFARPPRDGASGGKLLLVKGEGAAEELQLAKRAQKELCVRLLSSERVETGTQLLFEKTAPTPVCYPRANGLPKRQPL